MISAYLCGSLLGQAPLLGGTADIDLVIVHNGEPAARREIVHLSDEVHLDLAHHDRDVYREGRALRSHPWLGPTIFECQILYDPQHFMDFVQAGVRGLFHRPDYVLARAQRLLEQAREIWSAYYQNESPPEPADVQRYLEAVAYAINAVASLNGAPLPERRLLLLFPARAEAVERPGLYVGGLGLLGGHDMDDGALPAWLEAWTEAFDTSAAAEDGPIALHPDRRAYYRSAFQAMLESGEPRSALWPMLYTWTRAAACLPDDSPVREPWMAACLSLELTGAYFQSRIAALDVYLDTVEETLETWAQAHGA